MILRPRNVIQTSKTREQAVSFLEKIRLGNKEGFDRHTTSAELASYLRDHVCTPEEFYEAYVVGLRQSVREHTLVVDNPLRYIHGVSSQNQERLQSTPLEQLLAEEKPLFLRRTELSQFEVRPVLFYEEYTLNPEIRQVGADSGDYRKHSTLIFKGQTCIGAASVKDLFLEIPHTDRTEEDYPRLREILLVSLAHKETPYLAERTARWVDFETANTYLQGERRNNFETLPETLKREAGSVKEIMSYLHSSYDRKLVLLQHPDVEHVRNWWESSIIKGLWEDAGRGETRRRGELITSNYELTQSILQRTGGLTASAIDALVSMQRQDEGIGRKRLSVMGTLAEGIVYPLLDGAVYLAEKVLFRK